MRKVEDKFDIVNDIEAYEFATYMDMFPYECTWACDEKAQEGYIFCCGQCL